MKFTDNTAQAKTQRTITKDGFLVVPATISKIGVFDYLAKELGMQEDGIKKVARTEKSLFSDETIQSFENATLTIGHPADGVNAKNWKALSVGVVRNVKRVGDELAAEAWIYDEAAIKTVQEKGIEQLSCGYDCDIQPSTLQDADFEMSPMIGNHVAIVAKGRCGGTVKLADKDKTFMGKTAKLLDSILGAFGIKLSDEQKEKLDENEQDGEKSSSEKPDEKAPESKKEASTSKEADDEEKKTIKDTALLLENEQLKAQIAQLQDSQNQAAVRAKTLTDAAQHFPDVKFADSDNVRQIQEKAILDQALATGDELKTLSDAQVEGMYFVAKKTAKANLGAQLGRALLGDSQPAQAVNLNQLFGGK